LPDCAALHKELKSRKNVTLQLLWEELQAGPIHRATPTVGTASFTAHGSGNWTWCCGRNTAPGKRLRGLRRADDAGDGPKTGEVRQAQVFVAVLGASNYTYAEATWDAEPVGLDPLACAGF